MSPSARVYFEVIGSESAFRTQTPRTPNVCSVEVSVSPQAHACAGRRTLAIASEVSAKRKRSPLIWRWALKHTSYVHTRADLATETWAAAHFSLVGFWLRTNLVLSLIHI